jgi:GT2 family glycosyltransferase
MYYEDIDYCLRLQSAAFTLSVAEGTAVLHREGGSSKKLSAPADRYLTRSALLFLERHSPTPKLSMVVFLLLKIVRRIASMRWSNVRAIIGGLKDYRAGTLIGSNL